MGTQNSENKNSTLTYNQSLLADMASKLFLMEKGLDKSRSFM